MCDSICENEKKYVLGPIPVIPLHSNYNSSPCGISQGCSSYTTPVPIPAPIPAPTPAISNIVHESTITVPVVKYKEKIVQIPRTEYRPYEVIKEVEAPVYKDVYKYKDVKVPQKMFKVKPIYKVVDVPHVKHVDKFVKQKYKRINYVPKEVQVPFRPKRKIYTEIPVPRHVPHNIESVIQGQSVDNTYHNQLPLFDGYDQNIIHMMNPFTISPKREKSGCPLNILCGGKDNGVSYMNSRTMLPQPIPHIYTANNRNDNSLCCSGNSTEVYPNSHGMLGYNYYPLVVKSEDDNNICTTFIEATSSVLAAAGIFVLLLGKLSLNGISLFCRKGVQEDEQNEIYNKSNKIEKESPPKNLQFKKE